MTDTLPSGVTFAGNLTASTGAPTESAGTVRWSGSVPPAEPVIIQFEAVVSSGTGSPELMVNTVVIDDGAGNVIQRQSAMIVNGQRAYLPIVTR